MVALSQLGNDAAALDLLASILPVLAEGPFGQAHHVFPNSSTLGTWAIKAGPGSLQDYYESVGGSFADAIMRAVFRVGPGAQHGSLHTLRVPAGTPVPEVVAAASPGLRLFSSFRGVRIAGVNMDVHTFF